MTQAVYSAKRQLLLRTCTIARHRHMPIVLRRTQSALADIRLTQAIGG